MKDSTYEPETEKLNTNMLIIAEKVGKIEGKFESSQEAQNRKFEKLDKKMDRNQIANEKTMMSLIDKIGNMDKNISKKLDSKVDKEDLKFGFFKGKKKGVALSISGIAGGAIAIIVIVAKIIF